MRLNAGCRIGCQQITKHTTNNSTQIARTTTMYAKSLETLNMITQDLHQTPKMHMVTQDNNKDGHNNIGVTKKHINTQKAKQDEPRAQDKIKMGLRPDTKQGEA